MTQLAPSAATPQHADPSSSTPALLGRRLRHARLAAGLTLLQLARKAQCSESLISKVENGNATPSLAMLHRLGDQRSQPDLANVLVTRRSDGTFAIAIWNYAAPGTNGDKARSVHITVDGAGWSGTPRYHVEILDPDHGSALDVWRSMGSPVSPTAEQYKRLRRDAAE